MNLIDIHSHCNFKAYDFDYKEVIKRALDDNIGLINVGSQYTTSQKACEISEEFDNVYASVGLHPIHLHELEIEEEGQKFLSKAEKLDLGLYQSLLDKHKKIVAIGEIGLDYYWADKEDKNVRELQYKAFADQFNFAYENKLPVIIHCRKGHEDLLEYLKMLVKDKPKQEFGVIHNYYGSFNRAMEYINLGFLISFTGIITYSNSCDKLIKRLPEDKIMAETDCPYITPGDLKGQRNEPLFVKYVAEKMAKIRNITTEKAFKLSLENAKRLFKI